MKPHPTPHRIRKTIKWGGAAVTVLLVVVWVGSGWYTFSWIGTGAMAGVTPGRISFGRMPPIFTRMMRGFDLYRTPPGFPFEWWFGLSQGSSAWGVEIPMWALVGPPLLVTAAAWRNDILARRRERAVRLNLCPKCRYDRTGLAVGAVCPECGSLPA